MTTLKRSDQTVALWTLILNGILLFTTVVYFVCIIVAIVIYQSRVHTGDTLLASMHSPWSIAGILMFHDMTGSTGPEMLWWQIASTFGSLGYLLNIGVLTTSLLGLRIVKVDGPSWTGYLLGIIASGVSLTVIFNVMLWWLPGLILTVLAVSFNVRTYQQVTAALEA
ncbi:hypothetical protein [Lacticaseibacillus absianus]|uniref:hypothetical protein n=1 Tax=Lacticaseibacillus absianus TaxID=2729623 RepID=UPI0015CCC126|nr:hypothetical protein [Lacticaseibacillus absianus]